MQAALASEALSEEHLNQVVTDILRQNAGKLLEVSLSEEKARKPR